MCSVPERLRRRGGVRPPNCRTSACAAELLAREPSAGARSSARARLAGHDRCRRRRDLPGPPPISDRMPRAAVPPGEIRRGMPQRAVSGHHWVMLGHLSFAGSAFADLMRYQITDRYRPARAPGPGPNKELAYVDGLHIMDITLATSTHANPFTVNGQGPDGKVGPLPGAGAFLVPDVTLNLSGNVYFADVSEVARAGMKDPKVTARPVLLGTTRLWISMYVDATGVPHLRGALDPTGIPPDLLPAVNDIAAFDMPFPVTSIFAGAMGLPAGVTQVLN